MVRANAMTKSSTRRLVVSICARILWICRQVKHTVSDLARTFSTISPSSPPFLSGMMTRSIHSLKSHLLSETALAEGLRVSTKSTSRTPLCGRDHAGSKEASLFL